MSWIQTYSGKKFYPLNPNVSDIVIEDIIHSLSMKCRFGGHCKCFYSVAQHSIIMADNVPKEHQLVALLHDATEAYLPDVCRPIKSSLTGFEEIERQLYLAIAEKFGLPNEIPKCVKEADDRALITEKRDIMSSSPDIWSVYAEPFEDRISCWDCNSAKLKFELYLRKFL